MNWLKNIFKRKVVLVKVPVAIPTVQRWSAADQKAMAAFLKTEQGRKLIETCRHKLFSDHLDACQTPGNAEVHNASMRGANNIVSFMLYLASEDSISGNGSPANEPTTDSDHARSDVSERRAYA